MVFCGTAVAKGVTVVSTGALGVIHDVVVIIQVSKDRILIPALSKPDKVVAEPTVCGADLVRLGTMLRSQRGVSPRIWEIQLYRDVLRCLLR